MVLARETRRLLGANVVSERELRSFIGKATHVASLLYGWLPSVAMLWRPTAEPGSGKCPPGCVWARQVRIPLLWIEAFLDGKRGCSSRLFTLDGFLGRGDDVQMTFDASPWGLGGVLEVDGTIVSFFGDEFTAAEADLLKIEHGSAKSQDCVEALAILVGLRIWAPQWADRRTRLAVRSDSASALTMVMFARASGPSVATVSREIALDIAENVYRPTVVAHLPGVMNVTADKLSRLHAPGSDGKVPSHLDADCRAFPPSRIQGFYRALGVELRDEQIMCDPPENKS